MQYRCIDNDYCSMIDPATAATTNPTIGGNEVWYRTDTGGTETVRGVVRNFDGISMTELNGAERDVSDCKTWVEESHFGYMDLVCEAGAIWECLDDAGNH